MMGSVTFKPMNKLASWVLFAGIAVSLSGCINLAPSYRQPALPVADAWPIAATTAATDAATAQSSNHVDAAMDIGWRDFFVDERLQQLIALALQNNRDLRVAMLNVEKARAQYHVQRSYRVPNADATGAGVKERTLLSTTTGANTYGTVEQYSVSVGVTAFELDLFSRVRNLSRAALEQYLAQEQTRRNAQLSLIAEVANAYLTLASDQRLKELADETLKSQEDSFRLTQQRHDLGAVSALDVAQAQTTVESARADSARYEGNVAQDLNALTLLLGIAPATDLLPQNFTTDVSGLSPLPAQLPSQVLLRRPDVLLAEHNLRAANANIGAARAAFFPLISLTGSIGTASSELSGLFKSGAGTWSFTPQITVPIFEGGRLRGNLDVATIERDISVAQYEQAIQAGFRDVANALTLTQTLLRQRQAQQTLADAAAKAYELSQERYKNGRDSYLTLLDAQRTNYAAQQGLISTRLSEQANRITLYKALGGGWKERTAAQ